MIYNAIHNTGFLFKNKVTRCALCGEGTFTLTPKLGVNYFIQLMLSTIGNQYCFGDIKFL